MVPPTFSCSIWAVVLLLLLPVVVVGGDDWGVSRGESVKQLSGDPLR